MRNEIQTFELETQSDIHGVRKVISRIRPNKEMPMIAWRFWATAPKGTMPGRTEENLYPYACPSVDRWGSEWAARDRRKVVWMEILTGVLKDIVLGGLLRPTENSLVSKKSKDIADL